MPTLKEIIAGVGKRRFETMPLKEKSEVIETLNLTEKDEYEERAAIMEYDGGLSREEAERLALEAVMGRRTVTLTKTEE